MFSKSRMSNLGLTVSSNYIFLFQKGRCNIVFLQNKRR